MLDVTQSDYARHLWQGCALLASGQIEDLAPRVANSSAADLERFVQHGLGERYKLLVEELALVGLAFENFPALLDHFMAAVPKASQEPHSTDQQRFLQWLKRTVTLTPQQRDFVNYQQAEYACLKRARTHRAAHLAFQKLLRSPAGTASEMETTLWHLNPIRFWSWLTVPGSDAQQLHPRHVVFFPVGESVQSVSCSAEQHCWLVDLPRSWAGTLDQWVAKTGCEDSAELGSCLLRWKAAGLVAAELAETFPSGLRPQV